MRLLACVTLTKGARELVLIMQSIGESISDCPNALGNIQEVAVYVQFFTIMLILVVYAHLHLSVALIRVLALFRAQTRFRAHKSRLH